MLSDPRDIERAIDELRAHQQAVLADDSRPEQDRRDAVMKAAGEINALEKQARELREHELEQARATVTGGRSADLDGDAESARAFIDYAKTGEVKNALSTSDDANGGVIVPKPIIAAIIDVVRKQNPILADATLFTLDKPGSVTIELPRKTGKTAGAWVAEGAARPTTTSPTTAKQTLTCFEWYANPEATQTFLDTVQGADEWLQADIGDTFAEIWGTGLAVGTGSGNTQPTGLFTATSFYTTRLSSTADALDAQQILGAYFQLPAKFLAGAKFYGNGATFASLSALAWPSLNNTPLVRWESGQPTIMGKPVVICDDAPAIGNGAFPLAFGDLARGYAAGLHSRISVLRDPFTNKPFVGFYSTGRAGGVPWDPKAVLLLKSDNA